jgi:hypothetical protein
MTFDRPAGQNKIKSEKPEAQTTVAMLLALPGQLTAPNRSCRQSMSDFSDP